MTKPIGRLAVLAVLAAVATPLTAGAQVPPPKKPVAAAAPARPAAPAARPALAGRPAPAARAPVPRPQPPVARAPAPHLAPTARIAPPHHAPQPGATPHPVPQRAVLPLHQQTPIANPAHQEGQQAQTPQPQTTSRQAQSTERALRRSENRALRALPPQQRAARRQEIQNARQQRLAQPNARTAQPALAATQSTLVSSGLRRNGSPRVTVQAARQGRFAAAFTTRAQGRNANTRFTRVAAHQAWRHGLRASFAPWYGPVFWPYAYSDVFDYTFWPGGYDDGYWAVAYDDFFDGVFWGEAGPPSEYVDAAPSAPLAQAPPAPSYAAVQDLCKQPGSGVTAWPVADIERKVGLNDAQKQLLAAVKSAGETAAGAFNATCPAENAFPLTPPGRLSSMTARLDAMLGAVRIVRPPLENFYASLSDEQKERFNEIGPKPPADNAATSQASATDAKSCKDQKPGLTNLPIEQIEDAVKPTDAQGAELKGLQDATAQAVSILQAACPEDTPVTPPGRLAAMETRLQALIDAAKTVKPALERFYGSLSNEQKARFNRIGRDLAQMTGQ